MNQSRCFTDTLPNYLYGASQPMCMPAGYTCTPATPAAMLYSQSTWSNALLMAGFSENVLNRYDKHMEASSSLLSNPANSNIRVTLDEKELWEKFNNIGTEMIVTRSGRRMFPILKIRVEGMDLQKKYFVILDIVPVDDARYKFSNGQWTISGRAEPHFSTCTFMHLDSPATGRHWVEEGLISFHRIKLTNNNKDRAGNMLLNSMHRYQPRIHIMEADESLLAVSRSKVQTFVFKETQFFAVTAYQNELITKLKIDHNPFAKGFRDREKVFPHKRPTPFIDQLRAASIDGRKTEGMQAIENDTDDCSPEKRSSTGSKVDPLKLYNTSLRDLKLMPNEELRLIQQTLTPNPFFPLAMNNIPLFNMTIPLHAQQPRSDT